MEAGRLAMEAVSSSVMELSQAFLQHMQLILNQQDAAQLNARAVHEAREYAVPQPSRFANGDRQNTGSCMPKVPIPDGVCRHWYLHEVLKTTNVGCYRSNCKFFHSLDSAPGQNRSTGLGNAEKPQ